MLHALQVVLFNHARRGCLFLAQERMEEFFYQVDDAVQSPDLAEGIVLFYFEQLFQHGAMRKTDEQGIFAVAVLPGENRQFIEKLLGQIVLCQLVRAKNEQSLDGTAGGELKKCAVTGICQKDVVPIRSFIGDHMLMMTDHHFFLYFYLVEGDDEALVSGFPMQLDRKSVV